MKKLVVAALGLTLAASTAAYAESSLYLPQETAAANPAASIETRSVETPNLIAGQSPHLQGPSADATIDYTATASIGVSDNPNGEAYYANPSKLPRFGDGVLPY